jgi:hypothetical protein
VGVNPGVFCGGDVCDLGFSRREGHRLTRRIVTWRAACLSSLWGSFLKRERRERPHDLSHALDSDACRWDCSRRGWADPACDQPPEGHRRSAAPSPSGIPRGSATYVKGCYQSDARRLRRCWSSQTSHPTTPRDSCRVWRWTGT